MRLQLLYRVLMRKTSSQLCCECGMLQFALCPFFSFFGCGFVYHRFIATHTHTHMKSNGSAAAEGSISCLLCLLFAVNVLLFLFFSTCSACLPCCLDVLLSRVLTPFFQLSALGFSVSSYVSCLQSLCYPLLSILCSLPSPVYPLQSTLCLHSHVFCLLSTLSFLPSSILLSSISLLHSPLPICC